MQIHILLNLSNKLWIFTDYTTYNLMHLRRARHVESRLYRAEVKNSVQFQPTEKSAPFVQIIHAG